MKEKLKNVKIFKEEGKNPLQNIANIKVAKRILRIKIQKLIDL